MLGRDHELLGALAYLALDPVYEHMTHHPVVPIQIAIGTLVAGGFALLPDIDEPGSTVSTKLGVVSETVSGVVKVVSGGHRKLTHSLLFCFLVFWGAREAMQTPWAYGTIVCCALLLCVKVVLPLGIGRSFWVAAALTVGATYWVVHDQDVSSWLPLACAFGTLCHLVGDMLTTHGVPLFALPLVRPLQNHNLALPILGSTNSGRERILAGLMSVGILAAGYVVVMRPLELQAQTRIPADAPAAAVTGHLPSVRSLTGLGNKAGGVVKSITSKLP